MLTTQTQQLYRILVSGFAGEKINVLQLHRYSFIGNPHTWYTTLAVGSRLHYVTSHIINIQPTFHNWNTSLTQRNLGENLGTSLTVKHIIKNAIRKPTADSYIGTYRGKCEIHYWGHWSKVSREKRYKRERFSVFWEKVQNSETFLVCLLCVGLYGKSSMWNSFQITGQGIFKAGQNNCSVVVPYSP